MGRPRGRGLRRPLVGHRRAAALLAAACAALALPAPSALARADRTAAALDSNGCSWYTSPSGSDANNGRTPSTPVTLPGVIGKAGRRRRRLRPAGHLQPGAAAVHDPPRGCRRADRLQGLRRPADPAPRSERLVGGADPDHGELHRRPRPDLRRLVHRRQRDPVPQRPPHPGGRQRRRGHRLGRHRGARLRLPEHRPQHDLAGRLPAGVRERDLDQQAGLVGPRRRLPQLRHRTTSSPAPRTRRPTTATATGSSWTSATACRRS